MSTVNATMPMFIHTWWLSTKVSKPPLIRKYQITNFFLVLVGFDTSRKKHAGLLNQQGFGLMRSGGGTGCTLQG